MAGQIKAGQGTLIGNAGELFVAAELLKRGVIAALAPRNAPSLDMTATKGTKTARIRVKTKSAEYDVWQWVAKADGTIFRDLAKSGDFTVLVNLTQESRDMEFFIVPTRVINQWLRADFEYWVKTPGKNGRPHDPSNKKRNLYYPTFQERLKPYSGNWDSLWE